MKTYILSILSILLFVLFTGCNKNKETQIVPVKAELATFNATFLGKVLSIVENPTDSITNSSSIGYKADNGQKPDFIHISVALKQPNNNRIFLDFPTFKESDFTFEEIKRLLSVGKKEFEINPVLGKDGTYNYAFKRGFIFTFSTQDADLSEGGYRRLYDTMGEQNGSELKIIESKEIFAPSGYERAIQTRFSLNCKLYSGSQFIGNLKDADFTLKFFYKKLDF